MLAGWMTAEARLVTAFVLLLVLAAGILPARRVQAAPMQVAVSTQELSPGAFPARRWEVQDPATETIPSLLPPSDGPGELELVNRDRAWVGLPPLAESSSLDQVAAIRATELISDGITHYRPGHSVLAAVELLQAARIPYVWHGENIIWEGGMPASRVPVFFNDWWMASAAHRGNILNPHYRSVGIGVARIGDRVYMVEVFTDQAGDAVPASEPDRARNRQARPM